MGKQKDKESSEEQAKRFAKQVQDMIDAGELSPTEAEERFDRAMKEIARSNYSPGK